MASPGYTQCAAYLKQGAALVVAVFLSWFGARKEGEWLKEKDNNGRTLLLKALMYKAPEAVVMALFEAWPDAVKEKADNGYTPLRFQSHLDFSPRLSNTQRVWYLTPLHSGCNIVWCSLPLVVLNLYLNDLLTPGTLN